MPGPDSLIAGAATIRGDLRDAMIRNLAGMTKLWRDMPRAEQEALATQIDGFCAAIVTQIAVLTATGGRPAVLATLDRVTADSECRAVLIVPKDQAGALIGSTKQIVAIMQPSAASFLGEQGKAQTMPDQLSLTDAPRSATPPSVSAAALDAVEALIGTDAERCAPESEATLKLQQQALIEGRRGCQMFPTGTKELPLPEGMERVTTDRGAFHFNPEDLDVVSIVEASRAGEENLVLGLGPYCKRDVLEAAAKGDTIVVCVERAADGTEVAAAVSTAGLAPEVMAIMENAAGEGHTVTMESPEVVLDQRLKARPKPNRVITVTAPAAPSAPRKKPTKPKRKSRVRSANGHDPAPPVSPQPKTGSAKPTGSPFK